MGQQALHLRLCTVSQELPCAARPAPSCATQPLWLCRVAGAKAVCSALAAPCSMLSHSAPVPVGLLVSSPSTCKSSPPGCVPNRHRLTQPLCLCRVAVGGPLIPEGRHPPAFRVTTLPAGDSVTWQFTCRVGACARMTVQPYLDLPARAAVIPGELLQQCHCVALPAPACACCCQSHQFWPRHQETYLQLLHGLL